MFCSLNHAASGPSLERAIVKKSNITGKHRRALCRVSTLNLIRNISNETEAENILWKTWI